MKKLFVTFCAILPVLCASAQKRYEVNTLLPSTSPFYKAAIATNVVVNSNMGGVMVSNVFGPNSTNTAVFSTLLMMDGNYDAYDLQYTFAPNTNNYTTNYLWLYRVSDGVNYNTNTPIWSSGPITNSGSFNLSSTNCTLFGTNLINTTWGNSGYYQLGIGIQGSNAVTAYAQFFRRLKLTIEVPP